MVIHIKQSIQRELQMTILAVIETKRKNETVGRLYDYDIKYCSGCRTCAETGTQAGYQVRSNKLFGFYKIFPDLISFYSINFIYRFLLSWYLQKCTSCLPRAFLLPAAHTQRLLHKKKKD